MIIRKHLLPLAAALAIGSPALLAQTMPAQPDTTAMMADTLRITSSDTTILINPDAVADVNAEQIHDLADNIFIGDDGNMKLRMRDGTIADIQKILADGWDFAEKPAWLIVAILAIIICVPCLAMIIALMLLFGFLRRRNRERNELLAKAIDNNYTFPDTFYGRQSVNYPQQPSGSGATTPDGIPTGTPGSNTPFGPTVPVMQRNPRTFSTAMTLLVVGLCVFLFFSIVANAGVGFLFGGIPLFLGIGKMIGYFYVPGFGNSPRNRQAPRRDQYPPFPNNYNQPNYPPQQPPYNNMPPNGNNTPGNCPPPPPGYNG